MNLPNFHHHPDGLIYIRTDSGIYVDTIANFVLDSEQSYDNLPGIYIERYYEPGITHKLKTDSSESPQSLSWSIGDNHIANFDTVVANKQTRLNPV